MDVIGRVLAATELFRGLSEEDLFQIRRIAVEKTFERAATIFSEGDTASGFYVVAEGRVKIYKLSPDGKEQILHVYGPGDPFGEVPMFSGQRFPASAQTLTRSRLVYLPRQAFVDRISEDPFLALNMLAVLAVRLRQFTVQVENLSLKEVPGRLASYLMVLQQEQSGVRGVELPISKGQLASLLGTIPETLSRIFSKMTDQGLIRVRGRTITVVNPEGLQELADYGKLVE